MRFRNLRTVYHVFVGDVYEPEGGADDYVGSFATVADATAHIVARPPATKWSLDFAHITDWRLNVIARYERDAMHGEQWEIVVDDWRDSEEYRAEKRKLQ